MNNKTDILNITPNLADYESTSADFNWDDWHKEFYFGSNGKVNYAYEVTDYQVQKGNGDKPAFISQKADGRVEQITFKELADKTSVLASSLTARGLKAGDRFGLYAAKSIDYAIVLLAAIKCGAIVVPLFSAFGGEAIKDRLNDCGASWLYVTGDLIKNVPIHGGLPVTNILSDRAASLSNLSVHLFSHCLQGEPSTGATRFGDLETPFIIHYTSGSTGKPKGILLPSRAMIGHLVTAKYVLDLQPGDNYWNTGDPGWVTGMVYNFFAPLLLGIAAHIYEGPFRPLEWIKFMSKMGISVWYSTPTAFRLLRYYGVPLNREQLPRLRHIVSAGEPLNPGLIDWTEQNLSIPIHDSWYMTENGHQLINNYRCLPIRKGSMGKPLPGIRAAILGQQSIELPNGEVGRLAVKTPWPGLMKTVWGDQKKFDEYFEKGWYISGDSAYRDQDGYFWFQGREDDMIKSAGERISPFEIESFLVAHPKVAEAGVIGKPDPLFGSIIKAFILLKPGVPGSPQLKTELTAYVREKLSGHEAPREIEFVNKLPKTKSGKIMRRILRSQESNSPLGDFSTLDVEMNPTEAKK